MSITRIHTPRGEATSPGLYRREEFDERTGQVDRILGIDLGFDPEIVLRKTSPGIFVPYGEELLVRHAAHTTAEIITKVLQESASIVLFEKALMKAHEGVAFGKGSLSINIFVEDVQHPSFLHVIQRVRRRFRPGDAAKIILEINERPTVITPDLEKNLSIMKKLGYTIHYDDVSFIDGNPRESITRKLLMTSRLLRYSSRLSQIVTGVKIDHNDTLAMMRFPHLHQKLSIVPHTMSITAEGVRIGDYARLPYRVTHIQIHKPHNEPTRSESQKDTGRT